MSPIITLIRTPSLVEDGFEVREFRDLRDPAFQAVARAVYEEFTPGRNAVNRLCRGVRWGVYAQDRFTWLNRTTYTLSAVDNPQEGGRIREFDLIPEEFLRNPICDQLLRDVFERWQFDVHSGERAYECQLSAIRYEPTLARTAEPSPPYPHHDKIDGAVIVLNKQSILGGINRLFDNDDRPLYEFDLEPGTGFLVVDNALKHYVTDMQLPAGARKGFRDVLIVRFQPVGR